MSKRKYSHIKALGPQIVAMREARMTRQEIADKSGLTKEQSKNGNCNIKLSMFSVRTNLCYVIKPDLDRVATDFKPLSVAAIA